MTTSDLMEAEEEVIRAVLRLLSGERARVAEASYAWEIEYAHDWLADAVKTYAKALHQEEAGG